MERYYDWGPINDGRGDEGRRRRTVWAYCSASTLYTGAAGDSTIATQFQSDRGGEVKGRGTGAQTLNQTCLRHSAQERRVAPRFLFFSPFAGSLGERSGAGSMGESEDMDDGCAVIGSAGAEERYKRERDRERERMTARHEPSLSGKIHPFRPGNEILYTTTHVPPIPSLHSPVVLDIPITAYSAAHRSALFPQAPN